MYPRHLKPSDAIRYCVYYGKDRTKFLQDLKQYSLVITTYSVVRLDWKTKITQPENALTLHSVNWGRVVLDEGTLLLSIRPLDVLIKQRTSFVSLLNHLQSPFVLFKLTVGGLSPVPPSKIA